MAGGLTESTLEMGKNVGVGVAVNVGVGVDAGAAVGVGTGVLVSVAEGGPSSPSLHASNRRNMPRHTSPIRAKL